MSAEQTRADQDHVNRAMHAAWCRGAASILFEVEAEFPPRAFGSGGLGLIAAQLLDHAYCVENHSGARPVVSNDIPPSERGRSER